MDQSILKDILSGNVGQILPHLSEAQRDDVVDMLISEGVKKEADLMHMSIPILKTKLDTVDASELYIKWQNSFGSTSSTSNSQQPTGNVTQRRPLQNRNLQSDAASELRNKRLPTFEKDSPYIPSRVREAISKGERPFAHDREDMVERIVDRCREVVKDLDRTDFIPIAIQLVESFKASLKDTLPVSETGHDSLAYQLQTKFDNDNRWLKKTPAERNRQSLTRPEAFGCVQWTCDVPNGETEASLERKKNQLIASSGLGKRHWDPRKIWPDMELTFCVQRRDINGPEVAIARKSRKRKRGAEAAEADEDEAAGAEATGAEEGDGDSKKTILQLKAEWPFLFQAQGMNQHFKQLTGINFNEKLEDYLSVNGKQLINYLATKGVKCEQIKRKMDRYEAEGNSSSRSIALVRLLQEYFKESLGDLVSYVESTTEYDEVEGNTEAAKEGLPHLIVAGETLYDCVALYFLVDNKVVASTSSFKEAILMWFTSYYVFNIIYSTKLAASLSYFQKVIAGISTKGLKCHTAAIQKAAGKKANKLNDAFVIYQQKIAEENRENVD